MKQKLVMGLRIFMGILFVVFGLNFFLHFFPMPPMSEPAMKFMMALMDSHYLMPLVKTIEIVSGLLLVTGFYVPLALLLLAPILVNILLFHAFMEPSGVPMAVILVALEIFLAWSYRETFAHVLKRK